MDSGKAVTRNMIGRQNQGMYTTLRRASIARWMARPTRRGLAKSRFFGTPAVIGVSTKPGLIVRTLTPERKSRLRPWRPRSRQ